MLHRPTVPPSKNWSLQIYFVQTILWNNNDKKKKKKKQPTVYLQYILIISVE